MIDVWHFYNGGAGPELLAGRPAGTVAAVQLNDGPLVHEDFLRHARAQRRLPGEGELDVVGLIRAVRDTGFDGPWCVEVNTPEHNALPVTEAAKRAADAACAALDAALSGDARWTRSGCAPATGCWSARSGPPTRDALVALHARLSADTIYRRYFGARPRLSPADVDRFTRLSEHWRFALVAVREPADLVAVARYEGSRERAGAEIAIVVDDALQHQGVGRALFAAAGRGGPGATG